jgi:hypothetical protein
LDGGAGYAVGQFGALLENEGRITPVSLFVPLARNG